MRVGRLRFRPPSSPSARRRLGSRAKEHALERALEIARAAGAREVHLRPLLRSWLAGRALAFAERGAPPPRALAESLPRIAAELEAVARIESEHRSSDGSRRLLVALADGATVEAVLLARDGLCVSTQVGCAVGCRFCKTGESGLLRQLSAAEIVAQVALARRLAPVARVVLMGMGEPAHNLEAVLEALRWLGGPGGLAHKGLVFSTVGDPRVFERLLEHEVRPALALSLHTTRRELRESLLPRAPKVDPAELLASACDYSDAVTWPLQVQWTLLESVNDGDDEIERLAELLRGRRAIVNFIPWNTVAGFDFRRPDPLRARDMVRALKARGVFATIRRSGGQDVDGACGQLRARSAPVRSLRAERRETGRAERSQRSESEEIRNRE